MPVIITRALKNAAVPAGSSARIRTPTRVIRAPRAGRSRNIVFSAAEEEADHTQRKGEKGKGRGGKTRHAGRISRERILHIDDYHGQRESKKVPQVAAPDVVHNQYLPGAEQLPQGGYPCGQGPRVSFSPYSRWGLLFCLGIYIIFHAQDNANYCFPSKRLGWTLKRSSP